MKTFKYQNITQAFLRMFRRDAATSNDTPFHPTRDWVILFSISIVILVITVSYTGSILLHTLRGEFPGMENSQGSKEILNVEEFETAVDFLKKRKMHFLGLEKNPPLLRDPSLQESSQEDSQDSQEDDKPI
jgi:hypothetical protein